MYQGRNTTGRREGLVTAFTKPGVCCSGTRRKDFPRAAYGLVRSACCWPVAVFALLFLNSGFVCSYFTVFFSHSFFLKNRQLCLSVRYVVIRGARHLEAQGEAGSQNVVVRKVHFGK